MLGLTLAEFAGEFERVNLVRDPTGPWPALSASREAERLAASMQGKRVVLLGSRVARAFRAEHHLWFEWFDLGGLTAARFPHPSGLSRYWNDAERVSRAADWIREAHARW